MDALPPGYYQPYENGSDNVGKAHIQREQKRFSFVEH